MGWACQALQHYIKNIMTTWLACRAGKATVNPLNFHKEERKNQTELVRSSGKVGVLVAAVMTLPVCSYLQFADGDDGAQWHLDYHPLRLVLFLGLPQKSFDPDLCLACQENQRHANALQMPCIAAAKKSNGSLAHGCGDEGSGGN